MYRGNWFYWGLAGLALTIVLTVAPWAKNTQNTEKNDPNAWRLAEPIRYENLSVFPVLSGKSVDTSSFVTLDDALSTGQVVVTEKGGDVVRRSRGAHSVDVPQQYGASVNQLVLINRSSKPLLLLAGELVSGGKQDRIISKDRIVPPGADPLHSWAARFGRSRRRAPGPAGCRDLRPGRDACAGRDRRRAG